MGMNIQAPLRGSRNQESLAAHTIVFWTPAQSMVNTASFWRLVDSPYFVGRVWKSTSIFFSLQSDPWPCMDQSHTPIFVEVEGTFLSTLGLFQLYNTFSLSASVCATRFKVKHTKTKEPCCLYAALNRALVSISQYNVALLDTSFYLGVFNNWNQNVSWQQHLKKHIQLALSFGKISKLLSFPIIVHSPMTLSRERQRRLNILD